MSADPSALAAMSSLAGILQQIWAASIPLAERRRLMGRAVAHGMALPDKAAESHGPAEEEVLADFESLLIGVGKLAGCGKPTVPAAKEWLRAHDGAHLASRLGKASKSRNRVAHPDEAMQLLHDIREHCEKSKDIEKDYNFAKAALGTTKEKQAKVDLAMQGGVCKHLVPSPEKEADLHKAKLKQGNSAVQVGLCKQSVASLDQQVVPEQKDEQVMNLKALLDNKMSCIAVLEEKTLSYKRFVDDIFIDLAKLRSVGSHRGLLEAIEETGRKGILSLHSKGLDPVGGSCR